MATRLTDAILGQQAFGRGHASPMLNLKNGGQFGFGNDYPGMVSNSPYVRRNLIALLIKAPLGFRLLNEEGVYTNTLKSLVELHSKRIDGLQAQITVETQSTPFGGAGEQHEAPSNTLRQQSTPTFTWDEKYGRPINRFLESWIQELIMDPITKFPNVISRGGTKPADLLPDFYSATMLFMEPDPTHQFVDKAWLCANMFPKNGGEKIGRKDQTTGGDLQEYSVEFSAITQVGLGVDRFAQRLLDQMNLTGANPNLRPSFLNDLTADVKAAADGYSNRIAAAGAVAVQP